VQALAVHAAYSTGRIASYASAGAVAGGLGGTALLLDSVLPVQLALALAANALLVFLGLHLAGLRTPVSKLESAGGSLWRRIAPLGRRFVPADTPARALGIGAVWGWLPCGLVYSVLAMALVSGDAARGVLVMLAFGLGTVPNVLAAGLAAQRLRAVVGRPRVRLAAGIAVAALGILGAIRVPGLIDHLQRGLACLV
jgi:sulfite exporter TauE/SafE